MTGADSGKPMGVKLMVAQWGGICRSCRKKIREGATFGWDPGSRDMYCKACAEKRL